MHHLLKRQLKKTNAIVDEKFLQLVNQAYKDADEDRNLLEHSLDISSQEMQELYEALEKTTQDKLRRSEQRYQKMVKALKEHYFFYAHDTQGIIIYVSDSIHDILHYSVKEFSKHYSTYLTDDSINDPVDELTQRAINGEQQEPYIVSIYGKDGSIYYLEISEFPVFDTYGNVVEIEGIARDITSQYLIKMQLDYLAQHDTLTGILNRLSLYNKLDFIIANAKRNKEHFAVLFLDLDHFKEINDSLGHDIGDLLLKKIVLKIKSLIRETDVFARIGGDEFIIILTNINQDYISQVASKIVSTLQQPFTIKEHTIAISTSIGISIFPQDGSSINSLLKHADEAMYNTKQDGRNNFSYYSLT